MGPTNHHASNRDATTHLPIAATAGASTPDSTGSDAIASVVLSDSARVRPSKVRQPESQGSTLSRPRLLDWLHAQSSRRLVTLVAGAGCGKTTLLADFSKRTRLRTLWYRLDATDRNWRVFVERLVLSGQQVDPGFAPVTRELLVASPGIQPDRNQVIAHLLRELASLAEQTGLVIVLDDYHEVDDVAEVEGVILSILASGPDRTSVLLSSRRQPAFPVARLRLLGEVAELSAMDLRFDRQETEELFREVYGRPVTSDTADELVSRTEGWAASLHLVAAAMRMKSDREGAAFIRSLTGADRLLHDYLAEEVLGALDYEQQRFLMRASLLQDFDVNLCSTVGETDVTDAGRRIQGAIRSGLLQRSSEDAGYYRFHPLVREFLLHRLERATSQEEIRRLHRLVAEWSGAGDWSRALHHLIQAGERERAVSLLTEALGVILAKGRYEEASTIAARLSLGDGLPPLLVVASRSEFRAGRNARAIELAESAVAQDPNGAAALMNLMSLAFTTGDLGRARQVADQLSALDLEPELGRVVRLQQQLLSASLDADLPTFVAAFQNAADHHRAAGHRHYEGICLVNAAVALRSIGRGEDALRTAGLALLALEASSAGPERASARMVRAWAMAFKGTIQDARAEAAVAWDEGGLASRVEIALELADLETWFGSLGEAQAALDRVPQYGALDADQAEQRVLCEIGLALRTGDLATAETLLAPLRLGAPSTASAMQARRLAMRAHIAILRSDPAADTHVEAALTQARAQRADFWTKYLTAVRTLSTSADRVRGALRLHDPETITYLAVHAEQLLRWVPELLDQNEADLDEVVNAFPGRWREALRAELQATPGSKQARAWIAGHLDTIGEKADIPLLRRAAKTLPAPSGKQPYGKGLARRLADPVRIHDLNRVIVHVGDRVLAGSDVRRKALALMCFLVTRPGFAATRDEVMDSLWPDTDPAYAVNSLNQTAYFLRRVLEPDFADEHSPGYLRYQADLVWLDAELVHSDAADLMRQLELASRHRTPDVVAAISAAYTGKFALDFAYDDWSTDFRDRLHAAYLSVLEGEIRAELEAGRTSRGIELARRALEVDAEATEIELLLVRLYAVGGWHAAAAEQYGHYASAMREDLGVEVPPLEALRPSGPV